jgi:hypothetical protein
MRHGVTLALVVALLATPAGAPLAAADLSGASPASTSPEGAAASHGSTPANHSAPPDPDEDVLGWEGGYWHNESIAVTSGDGYNETEIGRIVARSMARVEYIRGLEFEEEPDVRLVTREEYRNFTTSFYADRNLTAADRLHQNTKFEALFTVPEDESYYRDFVENQGGFAAAFHFNEDLPEYGFSEGDIGIVVSGDGEVESIPETTLGHELYHFVQNNRFDNSRFSGGATEEAANVNTSLVEGDATYVGRTYQERCGEEWSCLPTPDRQQSPTFANFGLVFFDLGPYSTTATLFDRMRREGGVEAMNRVYENPPDSTEQFLHPETYPDDTPVDVPYEDRSTDEWEPQTFEGGVDHATFGEMGLFVMLWYPSYQARERVAIDLNHPFAGAQGNTYVQYDYAHPASAGWDGDEMFVYTNDTSARTNETGYAWKIVWDDPEDADEFRDAYYEVLEFRGGERVGASEHTWRIPDDRQFGDALHVVTEENTTLILNAPSVEDLDEIRSSIDLSAAMRTPSPTLTETEASTPTLTGSATAGAATTESPTAGSDDETPTDTGETTETPGQPGVGLLGATLALAIALLLSRRLD